MKFHKEVFKTKEDISHAAAEKFVTAAEAAIEVRNRFAVILSGGSTPELLYRLLSKTPYTERIDWRKTHLFWGDERCVPPDHKDSNYGMVKAALLDRIDIPKTNVHRIKGELEPKLAAGEYRAELNKFFHHKQPVFDLAFLGMGDDGHTASIFPGTKVIGMSRKRASEVYVSKLKAWRITLTAPVFNQAREVIFLADGRKKIAAIKEVWNGKFAPREYPAQLLRQADHQVVWYLDETLGRAVEKG